MPNYNPGQKIKANDFSIFTNKITWTLSRRVEGEGGMLIIVIKLSNLNF